jgi:hypothetical protein
LLVDGNALQWLVRNKHQQTAAGQNHLEELLRARFAAEFLKSQPGPFRVVVEGHHAPSFGPAFEVESITGMTATMLDGLYVYLNEVPRGLDMLNTRFRLVRAAEAKEEGVYRDLFWVVTERPDYLPRGWLVRDVRVAGARDEVLKAIKDPGFDPRAAAFVREPVEDLPQAAEGAVEEVSVLEQQAHSLRVQVQAASPALLVLSETHYPGWRAKVNGEAAPIHQVNGLLRGVVVGEGLSEVEMEYRPRSVLAGAALSLLSFLGVLVFAAAVLRRREANAMKARTAAEG